MGKLSGSKRKAKKAPSPRRVVRQAVTLEVEEDPNALAALAIAELDAQAEIEEARAAANTAALVADLNAKGPAYEALMNAMDAEDAVADGETRRGEGPSNG